MFSLKVVYAKFTKIVPLLKMVLGFNGYEYESVSFFLAIVIEK